LETAAAGKPEAVEQRGLMALWRWRQLLKKALLVKFLKMGAKRFLLGFTNRAGLGCHRLPRFQGWSPLLAIAFHTLLVALQIK